jgi:hypothetical protein
MGRLIHFPIFLDVSIIFFGNENATSKVVSLEANDTNKHSWLAFIC